MKWVHFMLISLNWNVTLLTCSIMDFQHPCTKSLISSLSASSAEDYRRTACTSFLKYIVEREEGVQTEGMSHNTRAARKQSKQRSRPMDLSKMITNALKVCQEFLESLEHRDIDRNLDTPLTEEQWEEFIHSYQLVVQWVLCVCKKRKPTGIKKTYDRVLRYFFWPRLKRDVASYVKACHICQLTGKPSQVVKPAPLSPIPALGQPFEHLIIDCVGPLPPSKSGCAYILTIMCQTTRYPAAFPLRSISVKPVVRSLTQLISTFGIPRVIQSNFQYFIQSLPLFVSFSGGEKIENSDIFVHCCKAMLKRLVEVSPQLDIDGIHNIWIIKPGAMSRGRGEKSDTIEQFTQNVTESWLICQTSLTGIKCAKHLDQIL